MTLSYDPRTTLITTTAASSDLEGVAAAPSYQPTALLQTGVSRAPLRTSPGLAAEQVDELIFGERFKVLDVVDGFAFGQAVRDGYVGWVQASQLTGEIATPTHRVSALTSFAFAEPSIKSAVVHRLAMNALVATTGDEGRFLKLEGSGWIVHGHLAPIGRFASDPAAVALQFLGAPYLWGGRTAAGVDCSGLVQQAFYACGLACPRDSDQQMAVGRSLSVAVDLHGLERNDLVFWPGHVGIMLDGHRLLHANASAMCVSIEVLEDAVQRIGAAGSGRPSGFRRV